MVDEKNVNMIRLSDFITNFFPSLFDQYGFIIKESSNSGNRFSGASIRLASPELEIFLAIERDEITADFRSNYDKRNKNWYTLNTLLTFLGYDNAKGIFDDNSSIFIREKTPEIIKRFHKLSVDETLSQLDELERRN